MLRTRKHAWVIEITEDGPKFPLTYRELSVSPWTAVFRVLKRNYRHSDIPLRIIVRSQDPDLI